MYIANSRLDLNSKVFAGCLFPDGEGAKQLLGEASERLRVVEIDVTDDITIQKAFRTVKHQLDENNCKLL